MSDHIQREILEVTQRLLDSVAKADWESYQLLCDPTLTCFEPEACNQLVEGLEFHRYYFALGARKTAVNTTICAPQIRLLGEDAAVISYVRLVQYVDAAGIPQASRSEETRIWQRKDGVWKHVDFHRSVT